MITDDQMVVSIGYKENKNIRFNQVHIACINFRLNTVQFLLRKNQQ